MCLTGAITLDLRAKRGANQREIEGPSSLDVRYFSTTPLKEAKKLVGERTLVKHVFRPSQVTCDPDAQARFGK